MERKLQMTEFREWMKNPHAGRVAVVPGAGAHLGVVLLQHRGVALPGHSTMHKDQSKMVMVRNHHYFGQT
jgi:hypothetical protein